MIRIATATLALLAFMAVPASAETCQECLDMLDINEGVKCWKENDCGSLTSGAGGSEQPTFEEQWKIRAKRRENRGPKLQTPANPTTPGAVTPSPPSPPSTPSAPVRTPQR